MLRHTLPLLLLCSCTAVAERAAVSPQRPTFSTNTSTTSVGTLEIESGGDWDPDDRFETPMTLKWGMDEKTELFLGFSPVAYLSRPGDDGSGIGDTLIGLRHRFVEAKEDSPSWAFQLSTKIPTAERNQGLGSGETDTFAALIAGQRLGRFDTTAYYQLGLLGDTDAPGTDFQHTLAVAASTALDERWGLFGELALQIHAEQDHEPLYLILGTSFARRKDSVFDAALRLGLNDDAPSLAILFGHIGNLGRVSGGK